MIDQHCHSITLADLDDASFASLLTESDRPPAPGTSPFDSALGLAVRRWCAPALGLPAHTPMADYLARRRELGPAEAARRLLAATGISHCLIDTGLTAAAGHPLLPLPAFAELSGAQVREVVRLESIAEPIDAPAADWAAAVEAALRTAAASAVAFKSVLAYRHSLAIPAERPDRAEVTRAAATHRPGRRLTDPVLLRKLLWTAVDLGLPIQLHTGFGDPDLTLHHADPSLLTDFIRAVEPTGTPLVLLHAYPYHRQASWLAQAFPHVYADLGLTLSYAGPRATTVLGEYLELAPFGKLLFSTDAYGLPELYVVGAAQYRHSLHRLLTDWQGESACTATDAERITQLLSVQNAQRLYRL
ncbi:MULTISPECIES: amidohydrolase family protein [unclassified Kitasatospora]|uniref:amidohydrolase family protein n=1 Tax=unclassified Kitasatospora TaxID=2633591 RepID=UPI00070A5202|nr:MULTISPECIES: amidohydrolase family protein [unclassified Kitasatospora]KQV03275.1 amidohydrolase [Kitasatospora sp. Root107]KRB66141.1 amidohydrolase [Kitasatospora sp. Root187]